MATFLAVVRSSIEEEQAALRRIEEHAAMTADTAAVPTFHAPSSLLSTPSPAPLPQPHSPPLLSSAPPPDPRPTYPISSLSSLSSVSSSALPSHLPPIPSPPHPALPSPLPLPPSSSTPPRSATVKQRRRKPSSHKPSPSPHSPISPLPAPPTPSDGPPLPPKLSLAELEAESKAHHHRLALDRPAFIDKRRAEEARKREERQSRVRRWPYIDARNIDQFSAEQEGEKKEREEQDAQRRAEAPEGVNGVGVQQPLEDAKGTGEESKEGVQAVDESQELAAAAASVRSSPARSSPSPTADAADTEDEGAAPSLADSDSAPATVSRNRRKKAAGWFHRKSKRRRTISPSPSAPLPPSTRPLLSLSAPPFPAPLHHTFGHFIPHLMLGNRVHFFDLLTSLPRDGDLLSYSPTRGAFLVRLDPTVTEAERGMKEAALQRWLKVEEQEVWEYIDVAWCRHPDRGGVKSWWPCDVVRVYREGKLVPPHQLLQQQRADADDADEDTEDEDDVEGAGNGRHRPVLVVHLLGLAEDTRLFPMTSEAVMTWTEGVSSGFHTRPTKAIAQALKDGEWTFQFHLQKWVNLEHQRRCRSAAALRSRPGQDWVGRSVSVLWDEDDRWYAGRVLQFNAVLNSLCVVYDDSAVEWVSLTGDVAVVDDASDLSFVLQPGEVQEGPVLDCYRSYHLYDEVERSLEQWEQLIKPPPPNRLAQMEVRGGVVVQDPTLDEVSEQCWECGLVDDVYLLASNMGMRAGMKREEKKENVRCLRCSKTCHYRCFSLMCDHLQGPGAEQAGESKKGESGRTANSHLRGGWSVAVDRKKPRCIDCLRCEHCGSFGAKELRPPAEEDGEEGAPVLTVLRSPSDFLVCDICDLRAHRQCVEPAVPDHSHMDGGWICRTCLQCRSCGDTEVQMEQAGYTRKPREDEPEHATHQLDDDQDDGEPADGVQAEKGRKRWGRKRADRIYHAKRKKKVWRGRSKGPSGKKAAATSPSHPADAPSGSTPTANGHDVALSPASTSVTDVVAPPSDGTANIEQVEEGRGPKAAETSSSSTSMAMAASADASAASVRMEVEGEVSPERTLRADVPASQADGGKKSDAAVGVSELPPPPLAAADPSSSTSATPEAPGKAEVGSDPAAMEDDEEQKVNTGEGGPAAVSSAAPAKKGRGRPRKHPLVVPHPTPQAPLAASTAAVTDAQPQPTASGDGDEVMEDEVDDVIPASSSPCPVSVFTWSSWSYACTMCQWCSERMRNREYCPICCSIWDSSAMIECNRCRRWVHIQCDPSASSFDQDRLQKATVHYHCPDCVKREQANEMMLILDALKALDRNSYFLHPVTEAMAPEYFLTIKTPMDFTTITNRLYALSYTELEQFKYDLNLVWRNAKDYNPAYTAIHKQAVRLQQKSMELLEDMMRKKGDQGLERKEGRIEDWDDLKAAEEEKGEREKQEKRERKEEKEREKERERSGSSRPKKQPLDREQRGEDEHSVAVQAAPLVSVNPHQRLREGLLALPLDVLRTFYPPQLSAVLAGLDACLVCGSMGDSEHLLLCSDCGEVMHWFCIDSEMMSRIRTADTKGGWKTIKPEAAATDLTPLGHASCINAERLDGKWTCPNCALCPTCHLNGELWGTRGAKRRRGARGGDDGEEEQKEVVAEQMDVSQLMIACDLCDRPYHVHCLRTPLPEATLSSPTPPAFRCSRCVSCHFCGARKPGKNPDARWMFDYTACQTCGTMWEEGVYCPVCEMVWSRKGGKPSHDGLFCQRCDKWTHVTCDSISPQQLSILRRPDFHYFCLLCRSSDPEVTSRWTEQLRHIEVVIEERRAKDEEKRRRAMLSQDFLTRLFPPFDPSFQSTIGGVGQSSSLLTSVFALHLQPHCVRHLHGLSLLEQVELLKNEVRRVQLKRRRERRAALLQQKRRRLRPEWKGRVWLVADEEVDGDLRTPDGTTEQLKERVRALMTLCFPLLPPSRVQQVPLYREPVPVRPLRPASPVPDLTLHVVTAPSDMPLLDAADPPLGPVVANGVEGAVHAEPQPAPPQSLVLAEQVKEENGPLAVHVGRPSSARHRARGSPLHSTVLTFASLSSSSSSSGVSDPRSCCFCHVPGDLISPTSAGRLLPAHPFHPLLAFAHVQCALWSSASYGAVNDSGQLSGFFGSLARYFNVPCSVCHLPGAAIPCRFGKCRQTFHFHCAVASSSVFASDMRVYCAEHADKLKKASRVDIGSVLRRLTIRLPRIEIKDGRVAGIAKAMDIREAEMVADGLGRTRRYALKRKSAASRGGWMKRKRSVKDEDRQLTRDTKEEKRDEGDADEDDEDGDDDEGDKVPLAAVNGDSGRLLLSAAFPSPESSRSPSPTSDQPLVKQEDALMKEEYAAPFPTPPPSDRLPLSSFHLRVGALTIHSLGVVPSSPAFHSSHFLYPEGYSASRIFHSYRRPLTRTVYHVFITADAASNSPQFHIHPADDEANPIKSESPAHAFHSLLSRFKHSLPLHASTATKSAAYFFGFGLPPVLEQLEGEEGVEGLADYERLAGGRSKGEDHSDVEEDVERKREREREQMEAEELERARQTIVPVNPTGSARTEGWQGKSSAARKSSTHKANFSSSITSSSSSSAPSPPPPFTESTGDKRRKALVDYTQQHVSLAQQYRAMKASPTRARVGHSPIHEWGLYASEALDANSMVIEYLGETIRQKVADVREKRYEEVGIGSCLSADHVVLTRAGWKSLAALHREFDDARASGAKRPVVEVASFNTATSTLEWKQVTATQRFSAGQAGQRLFRLQGDGMDVVATEDHRMLTGLLTRSCPYRLIADSFAFAPAAGLAERTDYDRSGKILQLPHSHSRVVVRGATNRQPPFQFSVAGLERLCAWWWAHDKQLGFLRFLGFWLGDGHLEVSKGFVCISQRKLEATAWLIDLLDEVFPRWWRRANSRHDAAGTTFEYTVRCPPLYEYMRVMAIGPAGYNPMDPKQLRKYPHFDRDESVVKAEAASTYCPRSTLGGWTESDMMAAVSAGPLSRPCIVCGGASGVRVSCSGKRCRPVDVITRAHPACIGRAIEQAFSRRTTTASGKNKNYPWPWFCPHAECQHEAALWTASHPITAADEHGDVESADETDGGQPVAAAGAAPVQQMAPVQQVAALMQQQVAGARIVAPGVVWNNGVWDIDADGKWYYRKRWLGPDAVVATTFANVSQRQAVALLEGFNRADGTSGFVKFNKAGEPTGTWGCSNSSMPLIQHLQLISQLAGAPADLARPVKAGKQNKRGPGGRTVTARVDHWRLNFHFDKKFGARDAHLSRLAQPVDVSTDEAARGSYEYKVADDPFVYDITVAGNGNFLTQRLSLRRHKGGGEDVRAHPVYVGNCYMFRIDDDLIVDATKKGNIGRFINHSCDPCCVTKIIEHNGEKKIVVITTRRVEVGEEITYDYFFANEADRIACNCGARNCAGRLN